MTLQEIVDAMKPLLTELEALLAVEEPTEEQAEQAEQLSAKIEELRTKAAKLEKMEELRRKAAEAKNTPPAKGVEVHKVEDVKVGQSVVEKAGKRGALVTGAYMAAVFGGDEMKAKYHELTGVEFKTHTMANDAKGGIFVPNEVSSYIIDLQLTYGVFRRNVRVENMTSETKMIPRFDNDITAYWGAEATEYTASDMTFNGVNLTARKLTALAVLTDELDMNSAVNLGERFGVSVARQFAKKEDLAGFLGDATSTYGGIYGLSPKLKGLSGTIGNIAGLTVASGNLFSEFTLSDFITAKNNLPEYAHPNAKWYINRTTFGATAERVALAAGGVTAAEITGSLGQRFLGYPVEFVEVMPKTDANSQVAVLFGDLSLAATMGDRQSVSIKQDTSKGFTTDTIYVKANEYVDIVVHDVGNASATAADRQAGPIVGIISAAS